MSEGIKEVEFQEMLLKAAITRENGYNRRYHQWVFKVQGNHVADMAQVSPIIIGGPRRGDDETMREDCEHCDARGCQQCAWYGWVLRRIQNLSPQDPAGLQSIAKTLTKRKP